MTKTEQVEMALEHLRGMHTETMFVRLKLNQEKLRVFLVQHIESGQFISISSNHLMLGRTDPAFYSDELAASDVLLYVKPSARGRGLAKASVQSFLRWASERGAKIITVGQSTGVQLRGFESVAESCGLARIGSVWGAI
ncbi:MAG: GNAT family N-acetyltransferase [Oceanobacter sp.]